MSGSVPWQFVNAGIVSNCASNTARLRFASRSFETSDVWAGAGPVAVTRPLVAIEIL